MTPKQFYQTHTIPHVRAVAKEAGTSFENLRKICLYNGPVGKVLAERLEAASKSLSVAGGGFMTIMEILYPDKAA